MSGESSYQEMPSAGKMQGMGEGVSSEAMGDASQTNEVQETVTQKYNKRFSLCPMCSGKGYYEENGKLDVNFLKKSDPKLDKKPIILPSIKTQQPGLEGHKLDDIFKTNQSPKISRISEPTLPKAHTKLPPVAGRGRRANSTLGGYNQISPNNKLSNLPQLANLLPLPSRPDKHPDDTARLAAIKLNRPDWETKKAGLEECLQLAHYHPDLLDPHMSLVYRTMSSLLNNFRPQVTLFTCQAAREFFVHMRSTCRPELDELVFALLNRTADSNRYIRIYANDALDRMVTNIPTVHAVRPLVEKGPTHNNPLVRTATARLLTCVVTQKTPNVILTHLNLRESCKRILETIALLLADSNLDTRATAKQLLQHFIADEEFEAVYYADVSERLRKRVDHIFVELKYKKHCQE